MSEEVEKPEVNESESESTVGSSLISALFNAAEPEEKPEEQPEEVDDVGQVTDIGTFLNSENIEEDTSPEPEQVEEVKEEEEPSEKITSLDNSLFDDPEVVVPEAKDVEPEKSSEPKQEEIEEDLSLSPEQEKRLQLASYAEENFSEHKGLAKKYKDFFIKQKAYIEQRLEEDPDVRLDETDHEYQKFLSRNRPKFENIEDVVEHRTRKKAKEEALSEITPELEKLKEEQRRQSIIPKVEKAKQDSLQSINEIIPSSMKDMIIEKGPEYAKDQDPVTFELVDRIITAHRDQVFAFHDITSGLVEFDRGNHNHVRLQAYLDNLQAGMPDRGGKKFVSIEEYDKLSAKDKQSAYTLTKEIAIEEMNKAAQRYINQEISALEDKLRKSGFVKTSQSAPSVTQSPTPKALKPQPRQGSPVTTQQPKKSEGISVTSVLGF
jgi:hypothetical protein